MTAHRHTVAPTCTEMTCRCLHCAAGSPTLINGHTHLTTTGSPTHLTTTGSPAHLTTNGSPTPVTGTLAGRDTSTTRAEASQPLLYTYIHTCTNTSTPPHSTHCTNCGPVHLLCVCDACMKFFSVSIQVCPFCTVKDINTDTMPMGEYKQYTHTHTACKQCP